MKLIVLDRDGVINHDSPAYVKSPEEWLAIPGSLEAIARLNQSGYRTVIASNQSGLARNLYDLDALHAMHRKMSAELAPLGGRIDAIFFCPHGPDSHCDCRKPKPGLFTQIAARLHVELATVIAVGDSIRDIEAATAAGARPMLVRTGNGEHSLAFGQLPAGVPVYADLAAVADALSAVNA